jgi:hypothetical protein
MKTTIDIRSLVFIAAVLAMCSPTLASGHAKESATEAEASIDPNAAIHGVSLGDYRIRSYYPVDAQKSTVRFTLYAAVKKEQYATAQRLIEEHRQKIRDLVITATRLSPLTAFQEPDLAAFRRRVLVRLRRAMPELEIDALFLSEFDLQIKSL